MTSRPKRGEWAWLCLLLAVTGCATSTNTSAGPPEAAAGSPVAAPAQAQPETSPNLPDAAPSDVFSLDAILAALYDVISGPAGETRDWDRFRSLFAPGARLIPAAHPQGEPSRAVMLSAEDYVQRAGPQLESGGFFEREIHREVEQFGSIAHVFSTYDSRRAAADPEPFARGINSIQLLDDGTRWWVVNIFWDAERENLTIPPEYLPGG